MIVPIIIIIENVRSYFEFGPYNFKLYKSKNQYKQFNKPSSKFSREKNQSTYCFSELSFKGKESI